MQGTMQFHAYYWCDWCLHPGVIVLHNHGFAMKYPLFDDIPARRTARDKVGKLFTAIANKTHEMGLRKMTPLHLMYGFDIIDVFVPDPLHFIDEGVSKQEMHCWCGKSSEPYSSTKQEIAEIDRSIKKF